MADETKQVAASGSDNNPTAVDRFTEGVSWIMRRPLADRLTNAEVKHIKEIYAQALAEVYGPRSSFSIRRIFREIFGVKLFSHVNTNDGKENG